MKRYLFISIIVIFSLLLFSCAIMEKKPHTNPYDPETPKVGNATPPVVPVSVLRAGEARLSGGGGNIHLQWTATTIDDFEAYRIYTSPHQNIVASANTLALEIFDAATTTTENVIYNAKNRSIRNLDGLTIRWILFRVYDISGQYSEYGPIKAMVPPAWTLEPSVSLDYPSSFVNQLQILDFDYEDTYKSWIVSFRSFNNFKVNWFNGTNNIVAIHDTPPPMTILSNQGTNPNHNVMCFSLALDETNLFYNNMNSLAVWYITNYRQLLNPAGPSAHQHAAQIFIGSSSPFISYANDQDRLYLSDKYFKRNIPLFPHSFSPYDIQRPNMFAFYNTIAYPGVNGDILLLSRNFGMLMRMNKPMPAGTTNIRWEFNAEQNNLNLDSAYAIAIDSHENAYIVDRLNKRIIILDGNGRLTAQWSFPNAQYLNALKIIHRTCDIGDGMGTVNHEFLAIGIDSQIKCYKIQ